MALRAGWGSGPGIAASCWRSAASIRTSRRPAGFPTLERVAIALELRQQPAADLRGLLRDHSNTVQFGARRSLYAAASGFSVEGDIGFDVLIQLLPLHFLADFHASRAAQARLAQPVQGPVDGALEGPRPLRVSGKATFEILWCDFTVRFDKTLVDGEPPPLPPAVDVLGELTPRSLTAPELEHAARADRSTHGVGAAQARRGAAGAGARPARASWSCSSRSCRSTPAATSTPSAARRSPGRGASRCTARIDGVDAGRDHRPGRVRARRSSST